jgi:CubicO group peptidase (beta-lactamase class C family)
LFQARRTSNIVKRTVACLTVGMLAACAHAPLDQTKFSAEATEQTVKAAMTATNAQGLALAVIDNGQVVFSKAYGKRNAAGDPLETNTVMYGASLTKAVFAYFVLQLVDEGKLKLDQPIAELLPKPLPTYNTADDERRYAPWAGLDGDERWRRITPRMVLTHSTGFANFAFLEPDGKLRIHFEPGSRYAYSGAGMMLLQFAIERGLGLDVRTEMDRRVFGPSGVTRTSLIWRDDFRPNLADGFTVTGEVEPHDERSRPRVAGSMDTTIDDMASLAAFISSGSGLSAQSRAAFSQAHLAIRSKSQFPSLLPEPATPAFENLSAGLGVISYRGPQGQVFFKGGHNDSTANTWVCVEATRRCIVLLSNDVRAEAAFPALVSHVLGETGIPWSWEYPGMTFWQLPQSQR